MEEHLNVGRLNDARGPFLRFSLTPRLLRAVDLFHAAGVEDSAYQPGGTPRLNGLIQLYHGFLSYSSRCCLLQSLGQYPWPQCQWKNDNERFNRGRIVTIAETVIFYSSRASFVSSQSSPALSSIAYCFDLLYTRSVVSSCIRVHLTHVSNLPEYPLCSITAIVRTTQPYYYFCGIFYPLPGSDTSSDYLTVYTGDSRGRKGL